MAEAVKVNGLRQLDKALSKLPVNVAKKVLMRSARRAIAITRKQIKATAPVGEKTRLTSDGTVIRPGFLKSRVKSKVKLNRREGSVWARAGVFRVPYVASIEYGNFKERADPFIRPAWEATKKAVLSTFGMELASGIDEEARKLRRGL